MSLTSSLPRYDLAESIGPDLLVGDLITNGGQEGWENLALGYRTVPGDRRLRQLIAERHQIDAEQVVVTVGGMQALFLLAFVLCEPGDEAVISSPVFPNARNALISVGTQIKDVSLSFDNGYQADLYALGEALSPKTKFVSLASPQNPSGVAWSSETWRQVLGVMGEICPDAFLLVDETYREAAYGSDPIQPSAVNLDSRVVSVASLSKCHGAPGLRLGWALTNNNELRDQLILGKFATVVSCSAIDEALAIRVLEQGERILDERRKQLESGLNRVERWVREHAKMIEWIRPNAGALCCMRLKSSIFNDHAVDQFYQLQNDMDVRVASGTWFGEEKRVFRLGFGLLTMTDLEAGLGALGQTLHQAANAEQLHSNMNQQSGRRLSHRS